MGLEGAVGYEGFHSISLPRRGLLQAHVSAKWRPNLNRVRTEPAPDFGASQVAKYISPEQMVHRPSDLHGRPVPSGRKYYVSRSMARAPCIWERLYLHTAPKG